MRSSLQALSNDPGMITSEPREERLRADVYLERLSRQFAHEPPGQRNIPRAFGKHSGCSITLTVQTSRFRVILRVNRWKAGSIAA